MATIQYLVSAIDGMSGPLAKMSGNAEQLGRQLEKLNDTFKAKVELDGGAKVQAQLGDIGVRLARLDLRTTTIKMNDSQIVRARIQAAALGLELDKLRGEDAGPGGLRGLIGRLPGMGGGGILGGLGGIPGIGGLLGAGAGDAGGAAGGGAGIGGTGVTALGAAAGAGGGLAAILASLYLIPHAAAAAGSAMIFALGGAMTAIGVTAAMKNKLVAASFADLSKQMSTDLNSVAIPFRAALLQIALAFKGSLPEIMLSVAIAFRAIAPALQGFGTAIARTFGDPTVQASIRAVGLAFASLLKTLTPMIPSMINQIADGITGIAQAVNRNPRTFALIIDFLVHLAGWGLQAVGALIRVAGWTDRNIKSFAGMVPVAGQLLGSLGHLGGGMSSLEHVAGMMGRGIASAWDAMLRSIESDWRLIKAGIDTGVAWFRALPGRAIAALKPLGQELWNLGSWALRKLWDGMKSGAAGIFNWLKGFAGGVVQIFKDVWHWFSPSGVMFQAGRDLMLGLEKGIQSHAHRAQGAFSHAVSSVGSGVERWAPLVAQALRMEGLSPGLLGNVLYQMQTESGGNPNVTNLTDINAAMGDPSRGLMQTIMSTFLAYHWPGTSMNIFDPLANIAAALNYARHVYGPSLMSGGMGIGSGHGYDRGGWLMPGTTLAVNRTGSPEAVIPTTGPASMAEVVALLRQTNRLLAVAPAQTGVALGRALSGASSAALNRAAYGVRRPVA